MRQLKVVGAIALLLMGCSDDDSTGNQNNQNTSGVCGDGVIDTGEECDNGAQNSDTAVDACRTDCRSAHCGDGVPDTGEDCDDGDDGNNRSDACPNTCEAPVCGDGHVLAGVEVCDDGNTLDGDDCRGDCGQDMTLCGNSITDPGEGCDEGTANSDTVANACRTDCQQPTCGDAVVDDDYDEDCDDGALNGVSPNACMADCTGTSCGDGYVGGAEECDATNLAGRDCTSYGYVSAAGLACALDCTFLTTGCAGGCGNSVVEPDEECDDGDLDPGDGCDANCEVEDHWACTGSPSTCDCTGFWRGSTCDECVVHVDVDSTASPPDGKSWATAFTRVQDGVDAAAAADPSCEVWVAEGTYYIYESDASDRVDLADDIAVYGGFAGTETLRSARSWITHPTVLKGTDPAETQHVGSVVGGATNAVLDGFTITGGASGSEGGGLILKNPASDMTVTNCHFIENAAIEGAAIAFGGGNLTLTGCRFTNNTGGMYGGALHLDSGSATITNCQFIENTSMSVYGAAIYASQSIVTVRDSTFIGNDAGASNGGALYLVHGGPYTVTNCVLASNSAAAGGGIYVIDASVALVNCTLYGNTASTSGGGIYLGGGSAVGTFLNDIIYYNSANTDKSIRVGVNTFSIQHCDIEGSALVGTNGIIDADPKFIDAPGGDFRLDFANSSPCIDAGYGDGWVDVPQADITGYSPRYNASLSSTNGGAGTPDYVDMGAYEYHP